MDNSPKAAEIIADHERDLAGLRRVVGVIAWALRVGLTIVIVYAVAMVLIGLGS